MNLYGMVGNDPVRRWDYLGLEVRENCSKWRERVNYAVWRLASRNFTKRLGDWKINAVHRVPSDNGIVIVSQFWRAKFGKFRRDFISYQVVEEWKMCFCYENDKLVSSRRETRKPTRNWTDWVQDGKDEDLGKYFHRTKEVVFSYGVEGPGQIGEPDSGDFNREDEMFEWTSELDQLRRR
jgi:hypothetical protein